MSEEFVSVFIFDNVDRETFAIFLPLLQDCPRAVFGHLRFSQQFRRYIAKHFGPGIQWYENLLSLLGDHVFLVGLFSEHRFLLHDMDPIKEVMEESLHCCIPAFGADFGNILLNGQARLPSEH